MYASLRSLARRIIAENKWRKYSKKWGYVKGVRNLNKYFRLYLFVSLCLSSTFKWVMLMGFWAMGVLLQAL